MVRLDLLITGSQSLCPCGASHVFLEGFLRKHSARDLIAPADKNHPDPLMGWGCW